MTDKRPEVDLIYRPCSCAPFERDMGEKSDRPEVEHFDRPLIAAARVREHVLAGRPFAVHHADMHIKAAVIDGVRYAEE